MSLDSILINLSTPICIFSAALAAIGGWTAFSGIIDGIQGTVTGKIVLEDGKSPTSAQIKFTGSSNISANPDPEGNFSVTLPRGKYNLTVEAPNYDTITKTSRMLHGRTTDQLNEIKLNVAAKKISIQLTDKNGLPFKNVSFEIFDSQQQRRYPAKSNDVGIAEISAVGYGKYELVMGNFTTPIDSFLWTRSFFHPLGKIEVVAASQSYTITLPRIIHAEKAMIQDTKTQTITGEKFIAQPFHTSASVTMCGLGLGINIGHKEADLYQLRTDENSKPGVVVSQTTPFSPNAATSYGAEGIYGDFCSNSSSPIVLKPGMYWLVAFYQAESTVTLTGEDGAVNNLSLLLSKDGTTWTPAPIQKLDYFLVE